MPPKSRQAKESKHAKRGPGGKAPLTRVRLKKEHVLGGLLIGLVLVAFGIIGMRSNALAVGGLAAIAGVVLFLAMSGELNRFSFSRRDLTDLMHAGIPFAFFVLAVFFSLVASNAVAHRAGAEDTLSAVCSWAGSLACLIAGVLWLQGWRPRLQARVEWLKDNAREALLVLGIFALGLGLRFVLLRELPYPWSGDEITVGLTGQQILGSRYLDLFNAGWSGNPFPAFIPSGVTQLLLGHSILAVRAASAIVGALAVLFLYLLARELFNVKVALVAAAFLTSFPYHLHFSRVGVMTIQDTMVVTLTLWLVARAVRTGRLSAYLWAGIASGLTLFAYVGGRLVLVFAVAFLVFVAARTRGYLRLSIHQLVVYVGAAAVTMAPMFVFFIQHWQDFTSRINQVAIFQSGWLAHEVTLPGKSLASILRDQFTGSTLVYIAEPAYGNFFNSPQPYLTPVASFFFLIGMAYAIQKFLKPHYLILLTWFWGVVLLGGILTISPPANTRMIMTAPAVALLVALGLVGVIEILSRLGLPALWQKAVTAVIVVFLVVQNGAFYFGPYRAGYYVDDANAEVAMHAGAELASLGPHYTLCLLGMPRMYSDWPTIPFLAPTNPRTDIDPAQVRTADLSVHLPAFVVATPDNLGALLDLAERYSGGRFETVPSTSRKETLYYAYIIGAP